jgi:hypothetical protein
MREFLLDRIRLVRELLDSSIKESNSPFGQPGQATRIFRDDEIDLDLPHCRTVYPTVSIRHLKECSYAVLIYKWLRCGYAHEYSPHVNISHYPPSRHNARVSYIGRATPSGVLTRMVSFHLDYLIALTEHHAANVASTPQSPPAEWWIDAL